MLYDMAQNSTKTCTHRETDYEPANNKKRITRAWIYVSVVVNENRGENSKNHTRYPHKSAR